MTVERSSSIPPESPLQTSLSVVKPLLVPRTIRLGNGTTLRPNEKAPSLTVGEVVERTDNLPQFLTTHLVSIAREVFGDQYEAFAVGDEPSVSDRVNLLTKLIDHADDLKLKVALENLGFSVSERSDSPEAVIASLQAAGITLVQQDYIASRPRGAGVPTDDRRRQVHTVMSGDFGKSLTLHGEDMKVVEKGEFAYTAREDLMAAQEIFNSQLPPVLIKELAAKEKELRDESDQARKTQLAQELVKRRQTFYRAILKAYNVHSEHAEELNFTEEENRIAHAVTLRAHEELTYTDFQGKTRKTHRGGLNAIDANRLATSELISTFSEGKEAAEKLKDKNTWNSILMDRHTNNSQWRERMVTGLGISPDHPEYRLIQQILTERLNTDQRLAGIQDKLQSRFQRLSGGVLPENLVLNVFRSMGLKGIELLYRRSLTSGQQPPELPPELADLRIQPLEAVQQQNPLSAVLGKLQKRITPVDDIPEDQRTSWPRDPDESIEDYWKRYNLPKSGMRSDLLQLVEKSVSPRQEAIGIIHPRIFEKPDEYHRPSIAPPALRRIEPQQPEKHREIITVPIATEDILLADNNTVGLNRKQMGLTRQITEFFAREAGQLTAEDVASHLEKNHVESLFINADAFHLPGLESPKVRTAIRDAQSRLTSEQIEQYLQNPDHRFDIFQIVPRSISPAAQTFRFRPSDDVIAKLREHAQSLTGEEMRSYLANYPFTTLEYDTQLYAEILPFSDDVKTAIQENLRGMDQKTGELNDYLRTNPNNLLRLSWGSIIDRNSVVPFAARGVIREAANSLRLVPAPVVENGASAGNEEFIKVVNALTEEQTNIPKESDNAGRPMNAPRTPPEERLTMTEEERLTARLLERKNKENKRRHAEQEERGNGHGVIPRKDVRLPVDEEDVLETTIEDGEQEVVIPTPEPLPEAPRTQMYNLVYQHWPSLRKQGEAIESKGYGNVLPAFQFNMSDETYAAIAREAMRQVAGRDIANLNELESEEQRMEILRLVTQAFDLSDMIKPEDIPDLIKNLRLFK